MRQEIVNPIVRFFFISTGLAAYAIARTVTLTTEFPAAMLWVLGVGAAGSGVLLFFNLHKGKQYQILRALRFTALVGVIAFALVFGVTFLLSM